MTTPCDDCSRCTDRRELARDPGRTQTEVWRLAERYPSCGHRLHRHLHGMFRSSCGDPAVSGVRLMVDLPPTDSRLGRLLAELGEGLGGRPLDG